GFTGEDGLPAGMERIALVVAADDKTAKLSQAGAAYYLAKKYLDMLTNSQAEIVPLDDFGLPLTAPYAQGRSASVNIGNETIGVIGEFVPDVRKSLKLPEFSAGFELDSTQLMKFIQPRAYQPLPEFPGTSQDYTHEAPAGVSWRQ